MTINISLIMKVYFSLYKTCIKKCLLLLHKRIYNNNKHFLIHENVYRLIRDDV